FLIFLLHNIGNPEAPCPTGECGRGWGRRKATGGWGAEPGGTDFAKPGRRRPDSRRGGPAMRPPADEPTEEVQVEPAAANRGPSALLVFIYPVGPQLGARFPLGQEPLVLGRDEGCGARLDDPSVSRRHARVEPGRGGFVVTDLGGTNGTTVNPRPARHARPDAP